MNLASIFLILILVLGVIDELVIVALNLYRHGTLNSDDDPTISREVWRLSKAHPWIPFVFGALAWHFLGG